MAAERELEELVAIHQGAVKIARQEGKVAGIRLSIDELVKWAAGKTREGHPSASTEALTLRDAGDSLALIADRLEEEG